MFIKEIVGNYLTKGHNLRNAQNLAAEEILLSRIASSPLSEHVTLKGGIVMYNVANNERRVTQDIDFDLIRYSIDEQSIKLFVNQLICSTLLLWYHLLPCLVILSSSKL